jgi:hypothetical protein
MKFTLTFFILILFAASLHAQCISGNCKNGTGEYRFPSGAYYVGEFREGEITGSGRCNYPDGSKYDGQWLKRYPNGIGSKTMPDGIVYTGIWKKGIFQGEEGDITLTERGDSRVGCLNGNCTEGNGVYAYPDGSRYEGTFRKGKIEGSGTFLDADGNKYIGEFKNNFPNGKGTLKRADGTSKTGMWRDGEFIGQPEINKEGCISGDCINGKGVYVFKNGEAKYVGTFRKGKMNGSGTITYSNGEKYVGELSDGNLEGNGTLYNHEGEELEGTWHNGAFLGKKTTPNPPPKKEKSNKSNAIPKVWAVVVGISSYEHMQALKYTDDDAYRIYGFFKSPEGGALTDDHLKILIDEAAKKETIIQTLTETFSKAGSNDLIILYFSGHGLKGSFLPIDYDGYNNKLFHSELASIFKKSPAKYKLCIADACHSGSMMAMKDGANANLLATYYTSLSQAKAGMALIMSSKSEENSLESNNLRQGVFSHFLIRGLKGEADEDGNKIVTVQELQQYISTNVKTYTSKRQSPVIQGDFDPSMTISVLR